MEIAYDDASVVQIDGQRASAADLAVGQVVEVVASGSGNALSAREITVRHIVSGPVTHAAADGDVEVIGQKVRITAATRGDAADERAPALGELTPGTFLRVSGMRQPDGTIVASRVVHGGDLVQLSGPIERVAADHVTIAGTTVRTRPSPDWAPGEIRATGKWGMDQLSATAVESLPRVPFAGQVSRVEIEGYPSITAKGELRVGSYQFEVPRDGAAALPDVADRAPMRIDATVRDGRAFVDRVVAVPDLPPRPDAAPARPGGFDRPGDATSRNVPRPD